MEGGKESPKVSPPTTPTKASGETETEVGIVFRRKGVLVRDRRNARHVNTASSSSPTSSSPSSPPSQSPSSVDLIEGELKVIHVDEATVMVEWIPRSTLLVNQVKTNEDEEKQNPDWMLVGQHVSSGAERRDDPTEAEASTPLPKANEPIKSVLRCPPLQVELSEIKSYRLSDDGNQLVLIQKDGTNHNPLIFLDEGPQEFLEAIAKFQNIRPSQSDRNLFLLTDPRIEALDESLAALNLFDGSGDRTDMVSKFIDDFNKDPYSTALSAFSKIADRLIQSTTPFDEEVHSGEEMTELMQQSMLGQNWEVKTSLVQDAGEFEVVTETEKFLDNVVATQRENPMHQMEWELSFGEDGKILDFEAIRHKVFKGGADPAVRIDLWKYLLHYYPVDMSYDERAEIRNKKVEEYYRMKSQWESISEEQENNFSAFRERKIQIEKDVHRTDRTHCFFEGDNNENLLVLRNVLMTYAMFNFDLGYVQGMSDLLAPILYIMQNEVDAFWCFVGFMQRIGSNFALDQGGIREQLAQVGELQKLVDPEFHNYLVSKDSGNYFFCFRWILIWFKREFSFEDILRLWEVLWAAPSMAGKNYHLLVCVALLQRAKSTIIENSFGLTETLKHINDMAYDMDLNDALGMAEAIFNKLESESNNNKAIKAILAHS